MNKHQAQYLLKHASSLQKEAVNPAAALKGAKHLFKGLGRYLGLYGDDAAKAAKKTKPYLAPTEPLFSDIPVEQITQKGVWPNEAARSSPEWLPAWQRPRNAELGGTVVNPLFGKTK